MKAEQITELVNEFSSVREAPMGSLPARIDINTGNLELNPEIFESMPNHYRYYVLLHELGHYRTRSTDEEMAHRWAKAEYLKRSTDVDEAVVELTDIEQKITRGRKENKAAFVDQLVKIVGAYGHQIIGMARDNVSSQREKNTQQDSRLMDAVYSIKARSEAEKQKRIQAAWILAGGIVLIIIVYYYKKLRK